MIWVYFLKVAFELEFYLIQKKKKFAQKSLNQQYPMRLIDKVKEHKFMG